MGAIVANVPGFSQDTDYPFDKAILEATGSYTIAASSSDTRLTLPHGLPFTPLMGGNWSLSADFSTTYEFSTGTFPSTVPGQVFETIANTFADSSNVYISADNTSSTSKTIYYRVYGFQPSTDTSSVASIANAGDVFILNTDYNNTKLYLADITQLPDTTAAINATEVDVVHNLGYIPQVLAWVEANGFTFPTPCSHSLSSQTNVAVGTAGIAFLIPAGNVTQRAHYRIYVDA